MQSKYDLEVLDDLETRGKVSPAACLGVRTPRPLCSCCGGSVGIRRALRKLHRHCDEWRSETFNRWEHPSRGAKVGAQYRRLKVKKPVGF